MQPIYDDKLPPVFRSLLRQTVKSVSADLKMSDGVVEIRTDDCSMAMLRQLEAGGCAINGQTDPYIIALGFDPVIANIIPVLCHELVHVNQMYRGDLVTENDKTYWKGKFFPDSAVLAIYKSGNSLALPWEQEAHGVMYDLARNAVNRFTLDLKLAVMESVNGQGST